MFLSRKNIFKEQIITKIQIMNNSKNVLKSYFRNLINILVLFFICIRVVNLFRKTALLFLIVR